MTKNDFFSVVLKLFGLYLFMNLLFTKLPLTISYIIEYREIPSALWGVLPSVISLGVLFLLVAKSVWVSQFLHLDRGYDEDRIDFSGLKNKDIIKLAILLIGGFLLVDNIPLFLSNTFFAFKSNIPKGFDQAYKNPGVESFMSLQDYIAWGVSAFNVLAGYLLISNIKIVAKFISRKTKSQQEVLE